ncbi:MAG TPA: signal recognition particle receptor subunit alpha, partial [Gammaproteobacteria bacterium]|nr:signal recognition particle receptor subunit alpha [Gammaproteobacteria bacterium]
MFNQFSDNLNNIIKKITGQGRLTEANIADALREVRVALLQADVALPVAVDFITHVQSKAVGTT